MSSAKQYRKKPVVIEAMLLDGNCLEVMEWIQDSDGDVTFDLSQSGPIYIQTLEGSMCGDQGDYILKGVNGEFYPCKPDIFAKTYEAVK